MNNLKKPVEIKPPAGKLGVLLPGMGAVATTFIAGVLGIKKGLGLPIGSLSQMATIRIGKRSLSNFPKISDYVPLAKIDQLAFGGWDIFDDSCYKAALKAGVLDQTMLSQLKVELEQIRPMKAVFDRNYVKKLDGTHVKKIKTKMDGAKMLMEDIDKFKDEMKVDRLVAVWCGSTEIYIPPGKVHASLENFEKGLRNNDPEISPSMIYAYACIKKGVPYCNGAPNLGVESNALVELANESGVPISGKDFKTGQTLMKTILAPGLKARMLGLDGWYSTNILGNRDGEVLDDSESFKTKEVSKLSVLETILQKDQYPDLYQNICHKVSIHYYPPRGDNKEGWDNIDLFGWMGYPMQIKLNFLCRDSILAAPLVLDLALFSDLAKRAGGKGIQEWLSFYYKSPMCERGNFPEHDLFIQQMKLKNTLRFVMGDEEITHHEQ
ncbi:MAG TPA: inositol-3-phosphate synthase [Nitrospinota bacterium]|nr:inositol-3-phosphate synthase [Nitrospinota bacterium]